MNFERYEADLIVSADDFRSSGWKEVLEQAPREGYPALWQGFSNKARSVLESGQKAQGKALWLLADACSLMLSPASQNQPFKPFAVFNDRRSVIPEDFLETDLLFLSQIIDEIDDCWLQARLADLLWLTTKPRDVRYAVLALDAYRSIPLDPETWIHGGRECWTRAICLAKQLRAGAGDRLAQIEKAVLTGFDTATRDDGYYAVWLTDLLKANSLGRKHRGTIAQKLEALAQDFDSNGDVQRARGYFTAATEWFKSAQDEAKAAEMTVAIADCWEKEAITRTMVPQPSYLIAASCYENAVQTLRMVPRGQRATHRIEDRIRDLRIRLSDAGDKSVGEMMTIQTPVTDLTPLAVRAQSAVTGKSATEALRAFTGLFTGVKVDEVRASTLKKMNQHIVQFLFTSTVLSRDGRVIAKRPAMGFSETPTEEAEITIRSEMVHDYCLLVGIVAQGEIGPALEVLLLEHRLTESDFVDLARQSPIVPKGRAELFGKALYAGYELDFVTALHLLVPQVEHMVRTHLKEAGAKTTNLDKDGIENENGLSTLMELPEVEVIFGEGIAFELRSLFCDAFGPNLRNELAHGLVEQSDCYTPYAVYAWWLILRLTFTTWWNRARPPVEAEPSDTDTGDANSPPHEATDGALEESA
ncbi:DUF4209 domain-containing protein [Pseudomonas aeruginosa]|uniref:DUF4209 domain-containing protein n=1 Tax=Pseudomonas aeruginosa TaxID=287 RepID=UPI000E31C60B|nr:DUF4209 domain-containing protein [Pseudomonas aeruginosa]NPZ98600.1 DUF4209 domain-containing protein [Pseudomonas aeruginosa]HCF0862064.1 DUF4209 domain-containing protein [Pseudomonas aeruginosa]